MDTTGEIIIDGEHFETLPVTPRPSYARTEQVVTTLRVSERQTLDELSDYYRTSRAETIRRYIVAGIAADRRRLRRL